MERYFLPSPDLGDEGRRQREYERPKCGIEGPEGMMLEVNQAYGEAFSSKAIPKNDLEH